MATPTVAVTTPQAPQPASVTIPGEGEREGEGEGEGDVGRERREGEMASSPKTIAAVSSLKLIDTTLRTFRQ